MVKTGKAKRILVYGLAVAFALLPFGTSRVAGQEEPFKEIQEKLEGVSAEEMEILQALFVRVQELEAAERAEKALALETETLNAEIKGLETAIAGEERAYEKKQESLEQVLKSYQRMGPGSYLEILLDSDSLTAFLRRINALRDLTRNTGELMAQLAESRDRLSAQKAERIEKLALAEEKQKQAQASLAEKLRLKEELETYLASLKEERVFYQAYLADVQKLWDELKRLFPETAKAFSDIIEKGDFPADALKISFSLFSVKGSIDEKAFNDIVAGHAALPEMVFDFSPGRIEMKMPEKNLVLWGKFAVLDGHALKFEAEGGNFYGMPLEPGSIGDLLGEDGLTLDFKPLLGKNLLQSIEIRDGSMELTVKPVFF